MGSDKEKVVTISDFTRVIHSTSAWVAMVKEEQEHMQQDDSGMGVSTRYKINTEQRGVRAKHI